MVLGVSGFGLLLIAYILSLFAVIDQESFCFNIMNFVGAMMLAYYVNEHGNFMITLLPTIWAVVALYYMVSHTHKEIKKPKGKNPKK